MIVPSPSSRKRARIEIIPLIDIMFFLLATFLMVSLSMIKNQGVQVNLPAATTSTPQEQKDFAVISITEQGDIFYNKEKIEPDQLRPYLESLRETYAEPKVFINGDEKVVFGKVVTVLDEARQVGIVKVAIQTKKEQVIRKQ
ncbi:MAG TPA: biopolymer transporter ExbD [Verrucomicrobiae bacterium]|nr:biopolymer transporter ExbD [Verrucomicrobiae bacterium]